MCPAIFKLSVGKVEVVLPGHEISIDAMRILKNTGFVDKVFIKS